MNTQYLQMMQTPSMMEALINSSVSAEDANLRSREYAKMFSRNDEMKDLFGLGNAGNLLQKTFSVMQKLRCCLLSISMLL